MVKGFGMMTLLQCTRCVKLILCSLLSQHEQCQFPRVFKFVHFMFTSQCAILRPPQVYRLAHHLQTIKSDHNMESKLVHHLQTIESDHIMVSKLVYFQGNVFEYCACAQQVVLCHNNLPCTCTQAGGKTLTPDPVLWY